MGPWELSVRKGMKHQIVIFEKRDGETTGKVLTRVKAYKQALLSKKPDYIVEIISRKIAFAPPKNIELKKKEWWCPYCCKPRRFHENDYLGVRQCDICGISDQDYFVKRYNWTKYTDWVAYEKKKREARR